MGGLNYIARRFKVELVYEKNLKKKILKSKYETIEKTNKIDYNEVKLNEFLVDNDIKVYIFIPKKGKELYNYLNVKGVSLNKIFSSYINDNDGLEKINKELNGLYKNQIKHPIFLFEKDETIMYVTATHTARCDMLYIETETKAEKCRILKERIEFVKKDIDEITVGVPYVCTNKEDSFMYTILKEGKLYNSYELNLDLDLNNIQKGSGDRTFFDEWYEFTEANNGIELKEKVVDKISTSRISIINYNGELYGNNKKFVSTEQIEFKTGYNKAVDCDKTLKDLTDNLNKKKF